MNDRLREFMQKMQALCDEYGVEWDADNAWYKLMCEADRKMVKGTGTAEQPRGLITVIKRGA